MVFIVLKHRSSLEVTNPATHLLAQYFDSVALFSISFKPDYNFNDFVVSYFTNKWSSPTKQFPIHTTQQSISIKFLPNVTGICSARKRKPIGVGRPSPGVRLCIRRSHGDAERGSPLHQRIPHSAASNVPSGQYARRSNSSPSPSL